DRARGARGRRRPQGRPVDRVADPRLPRAAQGPGRGRGRACGRRRGGDRVSVLVLGVSHKSAPVAVLEQLALGDDGVRKLLLDVLDCEHVGEATVLATCNRLEVYADVDRFHGSVEMLSRLLCERSGVAPEDVLPHLYVHYDDGAVAHLFHVAAGLDSMVLGEGQILTQAREALRLGQDVGSVGSTLNVLFQQAFRVAKRAHAETGIDSVAPSVVSAALERATE